MSVNVLRKYKKDTALEMRKKGFSYSRIQYELGVPKSTLSFWLKNLELNDEQKEKLENWKIKTIKENAKKRIKKTLAEIEQVKNESAKAISKISSRELWLMGIILYWKSKNKNDEKNGIHFSSDNPEQINLFLKWLRDIGKIEKDEIELDIFYKATKENAIAYWSSVTGFSRGLFIHNYLIKAKRGKRAGEESFLRIRVNGSSMLARQAAGWIEGIKKILNINDFN